MVGVAVGDQHGLDLRRVEPRPGHLRQEHLFVLVRIEGVDQHDAVGGLHGIDRGSLVAERPDVVEQLGRLYRRVADQVHPHAGRAEVFRDGPPLIARQGPRLVQMGLVGRPVGRP